MSIFQKSPDALTAQATNREWPRHQSTTADGAYGIGDATPRWQTPGTTLRCPGPLKSRSGLLRKTPDPPPAAPRRSELPAANVRPESDPNGETENKPGC